MTRKPTNLKSTFSFTCVFAAVFLSSHAQANPLTCTYGELSRKIEVVYADPGQPLPCEVIYDKSAEGSIEALWRADNDAGYCEARAAGLAEKLSSMGWQCSASDDEADSSETAAMPPG